MKKKVQYVYLVYCNVEKLVYGVYFSKKSALKYAQSLIEYRKTNTQKDGLDFSFYHYEKENKRRETDLERREKVIFTCCIRSIDKYLDGCYIQVIRREISK